MLCNQEEANKSLLLYVFDACTKKLVVIALYYDFRFHMHELWGKFSVEKHKRRLQYTNKLRFWENKLPEHYESVTNSQSLIQYLCLMKVLRELCETFGVSLERQQEVLFSKNFFGLRACHFRAFNGFVILIFIHLIYLRIVALNG